MKKKYLLGIAFTALAWTSCTQDDSLNYIGEDNSVFTGNLEMLSTRTSLGDDNKVYWVVNDELSIFKTSNLNRKFKVSIVNNGSATFDYVSYIPNAGNFKLTVSNNYAVYPYSDDNAIAADGTIYAPVKSDYTYESRSTFISSALMTSTSTGTNFNFKNVQGYLRLRLCAVIPEDYDQVESITLTSDSKYLNGTAKITWNEDIPVAAIEDGTEPNKSLTVTLSEPQYLPSKESGNYVELYLPVLPMEFPAENVNLKVTFKDGTSYTKRNRKPFTITRGEVTGMKLTISDDETFTGDIENEIIDNSATNEQSFVAALQQGGEIVLENDITLTQPYTIINKNVTLDLNGYTIKSSRNYIANTGLKTSEISVLYVDGCELTIKGEGSIENTATEGAYAISLDNGAKVTIEGNITCGSYYDAFYVKHGELNIANGFHYASEDTNGLPDQTVCGNNSCHVASVINCYDDNYWYGLAKVSLTGGVYVNFDPSKVWEGKMHLQNFVADGYKVISETQSNGDIWYKVVPGN